MHACFSHFLPRMYSLRLITCILRRWWTDRCLLAHAIHLAKLIPSNLSAQPASIPTISEFLSRTSLPVEIIAFTACILDALSHRFASSWRAANLASAVVPFQFASLAVNSRQPPPIPAEVVVLAALTLAHGWLEDRPRSIAHWASIEGGGKFTSKELEISRACILRDVDYGLFRITEDMVRRMVRDLQRTASSDSVGSVVKNGAASMEGKRKPKLSLDMQGTAFWMYGMVTPEPSP